MAKGQIATPEEAIMSKIYVIRGKKVMLDRDLALLYEVGTKVLNQAVKRNMARFPEDFMFQMNDEEFETLRSQFVTAKNDKKARFLPFCFTEQGVTMLSCVLNSSKAIAVNIQVIRVFSKMREMMLTHKDILLKLEQLERQVAQNSEDIQTIFAALRELLNPPQQPRERIGFRRKDEDLNT